MSKRQATGMFYWSTGAGSTQLTGRPGFAVDTMVTGMARATVTAATTQRPKAGG